MITNTIAELRRRQCELKTWCANNEYAKDATFYHLLQLKIALYDLAIAVLEHEEEPPHENDNTHG